MTFIALASFTFFCIVLTLAQGAPDCNNPLATKFNFKQVPLRTKTAEESAHCANLNNKPTCCSQNVFAYGMLGYTNRVSDYLEYGSLNQDSMFKESAPLAITNAGTPTDLSAYSLDTLNTAAGNLQATLFPPGGTPMVTDRTATMISNFISLVQAWYTTLNGKTLNDLQAFYDELVTERKKCYAYVGKVFTNLQCLACDADYASVEGVSVQTDINGLPALAISNGYCAELASNCYGYIDKSAQLGYIRDVASLMTPQSQAVYKLLAPDSPYTQDYEVGGALVTFQTLEFDSKYQTVSRKPNGCVDAANCPWLCTKMFQKDGIFNRDLFMAGGKKDGNWVQEPDDSVISSPTSPFWRPDIENSGFDFDTRTKAQPYRKFGRMLQTVMALITVVLLSIFIWI